MSFEEAMGVFNIQITLAYQLAISDAMKSDHVGILASIISK